MAGAGGTGQGGYLDDGEGGSEASPLLPFPQDTMQNEHIAKRLAGIQTILMGTHQAGSSMSSASKGREREEFINLFLNQIFPSQFRFGSGDITDSSNNKSGQMDVVIEYPFLPSLPVVEGNSPRLYLAEGVAAVIEVKSNIEHQWPEVVATAKQLSKLQRKFGATFSMGKGPEQRIPLYAVGYDGWKKMETVEERIKDAPIDGILVIKDGLFFTPEVNATGPWSLWGLIRCLHLDLTGLKDISADPIAYAVS